MAGFSRGLRRVPSVSDMHWVGFPWSGLALYTLDVA
jgi:hypothetical protein